MNADGSGMMLDWGVGDDGGALLIRLAARTRLSAPERAEASCRLVEVQESGMGQRFHHYAKQIGTMPGMVLQYREHRDTRNHYGRKLEIDQEWSGLVVTSHIQFFDGIGAIESWTELENRGDDIHPIEYVSSFAYTGLSRGAASPRDTGARVYLPHSTWCGEAQWRSYEPRELGYSVVNNESVKRVHLSNTGTWASGEHLPMGAYVNSELDQCMAWQIETSASWNWEMSDHDGELYLQLSGPSARENGFVRNLRPGERFVSVSCAVAVVEGGLETAIQELTKYRRVVRRVNDDNRSPRAVFNDYMNCLDGNPTTESLVPLIDAAARSGCKYFCIDCGWYADGAWWDGVGEWLPSPKRFPNGIEEPLRYIRKMGMTPGLWLELEVMGVNCSLAGKVPREWFFQRNGFPVVDEGRYQLDFRHPGVVAHADAVIRRLVEDYDIGYIKMDYNINGGIGTERDSDSCGSGLLEHTRAYLTWLDKILAAYPSLVIENCGSGGMRMEYSMLRRHSIQSVTDQTDYLKVAAIAANCMTAVTPEQAGIWSYPLIDGDEEEAAFNMVNAILFRVHQSGPLADISPTRFSLVEEGIRCHHAIVDDVRSGLPFWPIGLGSFASDYLAVGVDCGDRSYVAVWRIGGACDSVELPIKPAAGHRMRARCIYPVGLETVFEWRASDAVLIVRLAERTARLFEFVLHE